MKKHKAVLILAIIALTASFASLSYNHVSLNLGYRLWKNDLFPYTEKNEAIFYHDYRYHQSFTGKPLSTLKEKFPNLVKGSSYPTDSYRVGATYSKRKEGIECYWFNERYDDFGWCVEVRGDTIERISLVKG